MQELDELSHLEDFCIVSNNDSIICITVQYIYYFMNFIQFIYNLH